MQQRARQTTPVARIGPSPENSVWLSVVGIGDDGWEGLSPAAREAIHAADLVVGGDRHLALIPAGAYETRAWTSPIRDAVADLASEKPRQVCILASGNPLLFGVGTLVAEAFPNGQVRIMPHLSAFSLTCARLHWPETEANLISLCGRAKERLNAHLFDGARLIVLSADGKTPVEVTALLCERGFEQSTVHVLEHLGGAGETVHRFDAAALGNFAEFADLNTIAIDCVAGAGATVHPVVPGLADEAYEHDGQITKQEVRAITLARLAPCPGELLWDIGAGSGSIAIEWMRSAEGARAIAVERMKERAARARANANRLGVPDLRIIRGLAPDVLSDLPRPDAIFVGGGLAADGLLDACWQALSPGGRLVANVVTLESEAIVLRAHADLGGSLTRISIDRADPVGRMTGWRPAMPVTQWSVTKAPAKAGE